MSKEQSTDQVSDKRLQSRLHETPIAIVGMASVFAESKNLGQFWDTIVNSVNGIQDVPEDRWAIDDYYSADKKQADKTYCKRGAFLPEVDFDPMEFGLPPNILELTDITQLMALVVAKDVLADAGISDEADFDRDKMGVILGVGGGQKQGGQLMSRLQGPILEKVLKASGVSEQDTQVIVEKFKKAYIPWEENSFPGLLGNVIAGRIANRFNLGGTNCVVDAACAGSLAAIKMAVSDLLEYRSDMMISGGICCDNSPFMYMSFSKTPAFTDSDLIRPFDDKSNGMMIGEGVGMIALKRLEDAERDGDRIYSVIRGIGSSSDGRFKSIYAPRPEGQLKALKRAYDDAGFDPKTCGLIEAHGTGTKAGDAAEFRGLNLLFSEDNQEKQHVALGSVKSQVGHTKAAAGTAGLIKAALALHHKVLPATINVDKPNVNLDIENTPLYINSETRPWMKRSDGVKRQAGISSFGFGGTNFHFVLEEYQAEQQGRYRLNEVAQSLLFSADNKADLQALLESSLRTLQVSEEQQVYRFNQLLLDNPLQKLTNKKSRCGFVASNAQQAIQQLELAIKQLKVDDSSEWSNKKGIFYREKGLATKGKVAALFSGQGSQYVNMGRELVCHFPTMMAAQDAMNSQFTDQGKAQLTETVYPIPVFDKAAKEQQELKLRQTQYAQPAIAGLSVGLFNTFKQAGFKADFVAGHSFGELSALWAAGVFSESDYMQLAIARGEAMAAPENSADNGKMAAVIGDLDIVESTINAINGVSVANFNANNQVVIAGETEAVQQAQQQLSEQGLKVIELPVSAAFHTPLVKHAQAPFAAAIDNVNFNKPNVPVFANGTGLIHSEEPARIKAALKEHILESVQFTKEVESLYFSGARVFVEFGPKNVLTGLVNNILKDKEDVVTIATNTSAKQSSDLQLRLAAIQLAVLGMELKDIDPYNAVARPTQAPARSPLAMKLSGAAYVSPKTKQAFQDSLNDGWTVQANSAGQAVKEVVVEKVVYVDSNGVLLTNQPQASTTNIEKSVEQFVQHQAQLLDVHQAYLEGPSQYAETFKKVLEANAGKSQLPEGLDKTISMYQEFQNETLRVHEAYLNNQTQNMQQMLAMVAGPEVAQQFSSAPVTKTQINTVHNSSSTASIADQLQHLEQQSVTPQQATQTEVQVLEQVMLKVVAEKTGYPVEMLELSMDMEADLGIDSIKRVEILGAVQDEVSDLPELDAEKLSAMRTLAEIVDYMGSVLSSSAKQTANNTALQEPQQTVSISTEQSNHLLAQSQLQQVMLCVVADKTGYPVEMLDLSMDMEADLGIDSIKRVEILGAVQDELTGLPELDAEQLASKRTLAEIVDYMNQVLPLSGGLVVNDNLVNNNVTEDIVSTEQPSQQVVTEAFDLGAIEQVMLSVVAEKTGYPVEMLELNMDMEADLGIDSIKRVEILGAVQDEFPSLPELDAEKLSAMRTLAEIVGYMNEVASQADPIQALPSKPDTTGLDTTDLVSTAIDIKQLQQTMLSVVADKTGYPVEMLELNMDMEADLGIDSIKRVEILGAVQDEFSSLPELDAEKLSAMRTLAEIVDYMHQVNSTSDSSTEQQQQQIEDKQVLSNNQQQTELQTAITTEFLAQTMLSVVADKTGYPVEMLEPEMDMEADLGIDSIKRVEILGAVQDEIKDLTELDAEQLAQKRTLAEIIEYMQQVGGCAQSVITTTSVSEQGEVAQNEQTQSPTTEPEPQAAKPAQQTQQTQQSIEQVLLSVVSEKTGYPAEMIELAMDLEADLGIDSIKRVEILGAVQELLDDLPELDAEHLSEMRTLEDIINYMNDVKTLDASELSEGEENTAQAEQVNEVEQINEQAVAEEVMDQEIDLPALMLSVVAEKTGYPSEMLEMEMDMEADLGIDSIKRVEILSSVQDELTSLPALDAEKLSSLRTLGEVADYMMQQLTSDPVKAEEESATLIEQVVPQVQQSELVAQQDNVISFSPAPSATVQTKTLPVIETMDSRVSKHNLLMVNDGQGSTVLAANNLAQLGWQVTVISPSWVDKNTTKEFAKEIKLIDLKEVNEESVDALVSLQPEWQTVIYLHPKSEAQGIKFNNKFKQGLQLAFLLAKYCNLNSVKNDTRASFICLTRQGGDFATQKIEKKADLVQGGIAGLVKTLAQEWQNVFCRAIDVPSRFTAEKVATIIVNELNDKKTTPVEVGYNDKGRLTLIAKSTDSYDLTPGQHIDENAVFLVSGGAKGVTASCVIELAKQYKCKFILAGRSLYNPVESDWSLSHTTQSDLQSAAMHHLIKQGEKPTPAKIKELVNPVLSNREITATLNAISDKGGIAEYISVDVCDAKALKEVIEPICEHWGQVTGIIHGAGVLADNYIESKTLAEFERVYSTKVDGLSALLACCQIKQLKHLVLFSSAAGFYGNQGQSDYAIANEILNKTAYRFKALHPKAQVLTFNWGPWDGGMVTAELKRMFDERGVYIIPVQSGATLLANELGADSNRCVQIVVGTDMAGNQGVEEDELVEESSKPLSSSTVKVFSPSNSSLIADHKIGEHEVLPTVCAMSWMKSACEDLYNDYHYAGIEEFKIFKGIVFDGQQAEQFLIDTKLLEEKDDRLCIEVIVSSEQQRGMPFFHYRGLINMVLNKPQMMIYQDPLPELTKKDSPVVAALYDDGTLFHGPHFRAIKHIHQMDQQGLLLECAIDQSVLRAQGDFVLVENNVLANDIVYQAMLIWTSKLLGQSSLPSSTDQWQVFREVSINEYFFVKLNITKTVGQRVIGDILLIDVNGHILSKVTAAEVTCSATLNALFKESH